jgi:beta-N-acetylhexosaminidase
VILFDYDVPSKTARRNIESPAQVQKLCGDLQNIGGGKLFIAIDQEGGKVCRLKPQYGFPPTVSAAYLGQKNDAALTRAEARKTTELLKKMGINFNFAPCVDVNVNPACPVIGKL